MYMFRFRKFPLPFPTSMFCILFCCNMLVLTLTSCKPGVPSDVLSRGKMGNVLYDIHMAQALAQQAPSDSINFYIRLYQQAVYEKYGIDATTFYRSLAWYERHTDELVAIYKNLAERYGEGGEQSHFVATNATGLTGDTLDIWRGQSFALLSSQGATHYSFEQKADTSLHAGDVLIWTFNVGWHYHEGSREGMALLALHYKGDSVAVVQFPIYGSGQQRVITKVADRQVERIECLAYQDAPWTERPRIMTLSDIHLQRIRRKEEKPTEEPAHGDSTKDSSTVNTPLNRRHQLRDSLHRDDSLRELRPHFI